MLYSSRNAQVITHTVQSMDAKCNTFLFCASYYMNRLKEKALVYQIRTKKSADAFAQLYDAYVKSIYRFVLFKLSNREDAEDVTNEVFLKTWNFLIDKSHKPVQSFRSLIYRIARNAVIDVYRRRANKQECTLDEITDTIAVDARLGVTLDAKNELGSVLDAIKHLKQEYQDVIVLKHIEELTVNEISQALDKKKTAVRVTLHRATKKLKQLLDDKQ